jgi:hypothetical protein
MINRKLSEELCDLVGAQNKDCFKNSVLASMATPGSFYVEGWAITSFGLVVEHGWVEKDGEVIDPTPVYVQNLDNTKYFPGVKYTSKEIMKLFGRKSNITVPIVSSKNGHGMEHPEFRRAYIAATRAAYGEQMADMILQNVLRAFPE